MSNKSNHPSVTFFWLSAGAGVVFFAQSRLVMPVKLTLIGVLLVAATVGTWAEKTGAGPKMSEQSLLRLKVVGGVLAVLLGIALAQWLRPFRTP